ncbi:MAG: CheW domain-containing protein [Opitutaceae bacterium]
MSVPGTLGLFRLGPIDLAVPAELIEEVVRGPLDITPFPAAPLHVLGAFAFRGQPVPAFDLATLIQPAAVKEPLRPVAFALIIRHRAGRFALQVDEVLGLVHAAPEHITRLEGRSAAGLFGELYTPANGGRVAVVLDLDALLNVEGLRSSVRAPDRILAGSGGATHGGQPQVVVRVGPVRLAIDADRIRSVGIRPRELDSVLHHPVIAGFHSVLGAMIPVVELNALLGLAVGAEQAESRPWLVFEHRGWRAALMVDAVLAIETVAEVAADSNSGSGVGRLEFVVGSFVSRDGSLVLRLDEDALVRSLAGEGGQDTHRVVAGTAADVKSEAHAPVEPVRYLVHRAGGCLFATPLSELAAVMVLPDDFVSIASSDRAAVGSCSRLGRPVALVDLAVLLGGEPRPRYAGAHVLCITNPTGSHGFVVDAVDSLHAAVPQPLPGRDTAKHGVVPPFTHMIRIKVGGVARAACVLSLDHLEACLSGEAKAA